MLSGRRKLLLADDSPTVQKVIALTFEDEGFEVVTVGDGTTALAALEADPPPDILLADVHMPGPNGLDLCERVKQSERLRHVPVVLLIGTFEPFNEAEARRVGADTVLTKPFQSIRDLVSRVGSLLGGESKHEEAAEEAYPGEPSAEPQVSRVNVAPQEPVAHAESFGVNEFQPQAEHEVAFADFSADDELIEAKPADAFGVAPSQAETAPPEQFVSASREAGAMRAQEAEEMRPRAAYESHAPAVTREHDAFEQTPLDLVEPVAADARENMEKESESISAGAGYEAAPSSSFAAAHEVGERVMAARASFNGRASVATPAEDALLDLGHAAPPAPPAPSGDEDFILDLDDELALDAPDAPAAFAEAAHGESAPQPFETAAVYEEPAPVQDYSASHLAAAEVVMQDEPQPFALQDASQSTHQDEAHAPLGFVEPEVVPADEPVPASVESEYTDGSVEGDVAKPPAGQVGEARAGVDESLRAGQLSPEAVEQIARRVVELMSDKVVREIAWEVVPELAELLVKQRIDERKQ